MSDELHHDQTIGYQEQILWHFAEYSLWLLGVPKGQRGMSYRVPACRWWLFGARDLSTLLGYLMPKNTASGHRASFPGRALDDKYTRLVDACSGAKANMKPLAFGRHAKDLQ